MKNQLFLVILLTIFGRLSVIAQPQTLVLHHTDGQTTEIELSEKPRMTFGMKTVKIQGKTLNLEYARKDVARFTFKDAHSGVENLKGETNYNIEDDRIVFYDVASADHITVCSVSGVAIPVRLDKDGSNAVLPLSILPPDVCIVTLNGRSFKIVKSKF